MRKRLLLGFALLALNLAHAAEVMVFAAASLTEALKEVGAVYEKAGGNKVLFNLGASSMLARQIEGGAPADIFFSADEAKMDDLEKKGLILKETRKSRLSNSLVIVVGADSSVKISGPKDLAGAAIKKVALAETRTVPAGIYAKEYLVKQALWDAVERKVVPTENVRGALAAVEAGNVEAAIVYKTDAALSKKINVAFEVPASDGPAISYPVALVKEAKNPAGGEKFLRFLNGPAAAEVFRKHGFVVPE